MPARERRELWRHLVCDTLGPLDMRSDPTAPLDGEITAGRLAAVDVAQVRTSTPHSVHRTPGLIRQGGGDLCRVVLPISGRPVLAQDGREVLLSSDTFAVYDFNRPYDLAYTDAVELAVFAFPRALLPIDAGAMARLTATALPATGAGALVAPMLHRITQDMDRYDPATATRLSSILLDLLGTALTERAGAPGSAASRTLLFRVQAFIEEHLADVELTPAAIAGVHHVSLRQLQRLFAAVGTTVGAWIRERRLARCRADLAEPRLSHLPVGAVGARWGLSDAAHFSRLFRAAFGTTPSQYRRAGLA
jgi:AraC-like DNA-binding protein